MLAPLPVGSRPGADALQGQVAPLQNVHHIVSELFAITTQTNDALNTLAHCITQGNAIPLLFLLKEVKNAKFGESD